MKYKYILVLVLISFSIGCGFYAQKFHGYSHPSDLELKEKFIQNKEDFNELGSMFAEDSKGKEAMSYWIGLENSWTHEKFSNKRLQKYLELMNKLSIKSVGMDYENSETIRLIVTSDSKGLGNNEHETDMKGYVYSPKRIPSEIIKFMETDMLDSCNKEVAENWYIFHETLSGPGN